MMNLFVATIFACFNDNSIHIQQLAGRASSYLHLDKKLLSNPSVYLPGGYDDFFEWHRQRALALFFDFPANFAFLVTLCIQRKLLHFLF